MAKPRRPPEIEREQPGPTHLAKLAGIIAYRNWTPGDSRETNPYPKDSPEWRCWGYGWQEAQDGEWDLGGSNDV